jgi:hypothetical protein
MRKEDEVMLPKFMTACLAIVAAAALMTTGASAGRGGPPMWGTWRWPHYAEGGNTPKTTCGYVHPYPHNPRAKGRWIYQCR